MIPLTCLPSLREKNKKERVWSRNPGFKFNLHAKLELDPPVPACLTAVRQVRTGRKLEDDKSKKGYLFTKH